MPDPFRLTVAADSRFRALLPEVATRYVEVIGGAAADAQALGAAVQDAVNALAAEAGDTAAIDLAFRSTSGGVEVELTHAGRSQTVTRPLALNS